MDDNSSLISVENDPVCVEIANKFLGNDERLNLIFIDGEKWIEENKGQRFDYIFADTWPGKYLLLNEVLSMLNKGGFYIIDDMLAQPNWLDGHQEKAMKLIEYLTTKKELLSTKQVWATGKIIAVKKLYA